MKTIKWSALITMVISLIISIVSGYCTVIGMGKVFASASLITMCIATVIEVGRVILLYDLHHFWDKLKLYQKIPGILMLLIAMTLSAMGVYGFFANAHSAKSQEVIPIEMVIKQKQSEIDILNNSIKMNEEQLNQFDDKAYLKYTEMGYVTKAVNLQKEQQKITSRLFDDNRKKREEITKLNQEITKLQLEMEQKVPTLAHLKYYAKLFNVDDETAVIIFIVMIMTVFDTLAMYLMITSDWISKIENKTTFNNIVKDNYTNEDINEIKKILNNYQSKIIEVNDDKQIKELKENIEKNNQIIKQLSDKTIDFTPILEKVDTIKKSLNNDVLIEKLDEIENKINKNNIDTTTSNDVLLNQIINSIDENESIIETEYFKDFIKKNPKIKEELKKLYYKVPSVLNKLNKL